MRPNLVIFDCDGVLVDTEAVANARMAELFSAMGLAVNGTECRRLFQGKTMEDVCAEVDALLGRPVDPEFPSHVRREVEITLQAGVDPVPGVVDLVGRVIGSGIPHCVASAGSVSKMHLTLGHVGLLPVMRDRLFSAQDVGRGKPHPDVFLAAAAAMGVACGEAVIIEDSVTGVMAGVASGARVLGYAGDPFTDANMLEDAGAEVFFDMADVDALIGLG